MATISAGLVKDLREKTGAGMMDCKNALSETNGDIEAAVDWLRKKGLAKAAKKSGRVAAEGLVGVSRRQPISASSSRSIPKPTSSPATTTSRRWCGACWRWRSITRRTSTLRRCWARIIRAAAR